MKSILPGHKRDNQFPFWGDWPSYKHLQWNRVPYRPVRRPASRIGPRHYFVAPNYAYLIGMYNNRKPKR